MADARLSGSSRKCAAHAQRRDAMRIRTVVCFVACSASLDSSPAVAVARFRCLASRRCVVDFVRDAQWRECLTASHPSGRAILLPALREAAVLVPRCSASAVAFWAAGPLLSDRPFCWNRHNTSSPGASHPPISSRSPPPHLPKHPDSTSASNPPRTAPHHRPSHVQPFSPFGRACSASTLLEAAHWAVQSWCVTRGAFALDISHGTRSQVQLQHQSREPCRCCATRVSWLSVCLSSKPKNLQSAQLTISSHPISVTLDHEDRAFKSDFLLGGAQVAILMLS